MLSSCLFFRFFSFFKKKYYAIYMFVYFYGFLAKKNGNGNGKWKELTHKELPPYGFHKCESCFACIKIMQSGNKTTNRKNKRSLSVSKVVCVLVIKVRSQKLGFHDKSVQHRQCFSPTLPTLPNAEPMLTTWLPSQHAKVFAAESICT